MNTGYVRRRDFLRGSLAAAASLHLPEPASASASAAAPDGPLVPRKIPATAEALLPPAPLGKRDQLLMPHATYRELQLGSVLPAGWLQNELEKQANGITTHQTDFAFPFDRRYWASNERGQEEESRNGGTFWYPWEAVGYWTDGGYRCARLTGNPHLMRRVMEPIRYTVDNPVYGWFLGPRRLYDLAPNQDPSRWPNAVFFRALAGAAEGENDAGILAAMCRHYMEDTECDYQHGPWGPRDRSNIESMLWCYAHSGDPRLLDKAQGVWEKIPPSEIADLTADRPSTMHGVSFTEQAKLGALLFMYTGDSRQLDVSVAAMQRVFRYHMLVDGTPSTTEGLTETTSLNGHETCDIVEFNQVWGYLLMATGDAMYADRIERALFNAGMGAVRKDWTGLQYISCPNQLHIARHSCQVGHVGTAAALYGPNSDLRPKTRFVTACCAGNVSRVMPAYVQRSWMRSADGGLAAVLYGPVRVAATVGRDHQAVEISEETTYPFAERINFHLRSAGPVEFPLHLRIPSWCNHPQLSINGRKQTLPPIQNGFIVLQRTHAPDDVITLDLPMQTNIGQSSDGGLFIERGPLVYSLHPTEEWAPIAMPEFEITAPDYFPMWAATAKSPWNYALSVDPARPVDAQVRVQHQAQAEDPWIDPPVRIEVPARRIPGWDLIRPGGDDPDWYMTPPLPVDRRSVGPTETISLVPLGSTHLRLTVFPPLPADTRS